MIQTILNRRSVRKFTGDRVKREDLETLVRAGMAAPTSRDTRHLHFIVIDDPLLIPKMAENLANARMILTAKHAIIVACDTAVAYGGTEVGYWIQDTSAAAQNVLLAAHALGLGACWTVIYPRAERVTFLIELFKIPQNVIPLCVIAVGISSGEEKPRDKYDPTHVHWNQGGWS
ncbi:MAG: nitroreductase family protein [Candidatus Omnitrophica bacterium]|nr:nitroreductase family protein [Candidatus Omnitrophota bacterium]